MQLRLNQNNIRNGCGGKFHAGDYTFSRRAMAARREK
jgi:hypothetical protein